MLYVTLNNGVRMPQLGLGVFRMTDHAECEAVVRDAIALGYRLFDTAASYGNEEAVGRAIAVSGVARDEIFVTTKLWRGDAGQGATKRAVERALKRLRMDYVDLYLIHQPFGDYYGAWRDMEELHRQGVLRAIGVSNFFPDRLIDLLRYNETAPAIDQVEAHVFNQRTADQEVMQRYGVQMEAWAPFVEGKQGFFTNKVLARIARSHNKSVAQIALRWLLQRGVVAIPKSSDTRHLADNVDVFDFELTDKQMRRISALDRGRTAFVDIRDPEQVGRLISVHRNT